MIVDVNTHWFPSKFFADESLLNLFMRTIPRAYDESAILTDIPGMAKRQIIISKPKGYVNLNMPETYINTEGLLKAMDETGVDKCILRMPIWSEWLTLELARIVNDEMAGYIKEHSDRFLGLAIIPPWGDKDSLKELERCIYDLGLIGVEVAAHYGNLYLDAEEFRPFFKRLNQLGVPICVHHTPLPVDYNHIYDYVNLRRLFGRCIDQMTCVGRILYSEMLDELPNLRFIHSMLAGGLFTYADLMTPQKSVVKEDMERFDPTASEKVRGYLERNIYFDITHAPAWGKAQLECAVKVLGAERILFGSSYPLRREWLLKGVDYIRNLEIGEKEKSLILGQNAVRIFKIKT